MKKNMSPNENPFTEACKKMHHAATICHNWLNLSYPRASLPVRLEQGCMKSVRLALLEPGSQLVTSGSALQIVVLPAAFDGVRQQGFEHDKWQLLVYSWLGREHTRHLKEHLKSKMDCSYTSFFLVHPNECILL